MFPDKFLEAKKSASQLFGLVLALVPPSLEELVQAATMTKLGDPQLYRVDGAKAKEMIVKLCCVAESIDWFIQLLI